MTGLIAPALALAIAGCGAGAAEQPKPQASPDEIVEYHDSGEWAQDITRVVDRARNVLARHRDDRRPAMVLDIDDTSLSNYDCLKAVDFERAGSNCGAEGDLPAIPQTLRLYRYARSHGVTVFFITGRRERLRAVTQGNLRNAGYRGRLRVRLRPNRERRGTHDGWKARTRRAIQRRGYKIVVNLGDQRSDLDGGAALRRFKLPNPMYVIPEA